MTRRRKKQLIPTTWLDWTPAVAAMFGLVPDDWTPPLKVRVCGSKARSTWSARFRTPNGRITTARVRLARCPHSGDQLVEEESLSVSLRIGKPS